MAEGRSAKEVAALLSISPRTAEAHKARILEALGLQSTAELVQYTIRNGITSEGAVTAAMPTGCD